MFAFLLPRVLHMCTLILLEPKLVTYQYHGMLCSQTQILQYTQHRTHDTPDTRLFPLLGRNSHSGQLDSYNIRHRLLRMDYSRLHIRCLGSILGHILCLRIDTLDRRCTSRRSAQKYIHHLPLSNETDKRKFSRH